MDQAATDPLTPYPETITVNIRKEAGRNFSALAGTEWENHNDDDNAMYDIIGGFFEYRYSDRFCRKRRR